MSRQNLVSLFCGFLRTGRDTAVVQRRGYRRESRTYTDISAYALFWSRALAGHGVGPGDRVLLWGPNSAEWISCFWAIQLQGAVAVPMDAGAKPDFVRRVVQDSSVKLILRDREQPEIFCACLSLIYNDLKDAVAAPASPPEAPANPGDTAGRSAIAEILYTSGTTAEPRGVVLTHGNFLANIEPIERGIQPYLQYERWMHPLRFVSLVPLAHIFGQFMALFVPPLLGATVVLETSNQAAEIIRTVKRERATALITVPRMLDVLRAAIELEIDEREWRAWFDAAYRSAADEKFLRRAWRFRRIHRRFGWRFWAFISGGAALAAETEEFFKRIGYAVVQGYGMTESASLITLNHPFRAAQGSIGKVLPGREFRLAEDGEILVRGENVAQGYWQKGAVSGISGEAGGWLHTGDIGELDVEGNVRFRGRKKNVIVTPAGLNVYPEDLEAALKRQSGVRDAVVIALAQDGNAEPCAILLAGAGDQAAAKRAVDSANVSLAEYQQIRCWVLWPHSDFPRTQTGKPRLGEIAEQAIQILKGAFPPATKSGALQEMLQRLRPGTSGAGDLEGELNLSSLDRAELMSALEQKFAVELNETEFSTARTVADVEKLLQQPMKGHTDYVYPRWTQREPLRWVRLAVYYALVWPATQILGHPRIVGRENLREMRGPMLVISNHITRRADIGLILAALPLRFRHRLAVAMGGESLQRMRRPPREWFLARRWAYRLGYFLVTALFDVFPLPQLTGFRESFRFAGESVDRGYSVLVFPEGEVNNSEDGAMAPFRSGIGLLAENLNLPVVPMRLDGVWKMKREGRRFAHRGEITVRIGRPASFPPGTPAEEITARLKSLVRDL